MNKILENARQMYKLKNLVRYNNSTRIKDETVLEHTAAVSLIVLDLRNKYKFDVDKAIKLALVHDILESEISDIPYNVKSSYPAIAKSVKQSELDAMFKFSSTVKSLLNELDNNSNHIEQRIVKFADIISCKLYTEMEVSLGNTNYMQKVLDETNQRIIDFEKELEEFLE